jgi:hypothetical protein
MRVASALAFRLTLTKENSMTKFAFIGAAAVLCSALTVPAMAQHRVIHADAYIQNGVCPMTATTSIVCPTAVCITLPRILAGNSGSGALACHSSR